MEYLTHDGAAFLIFPLFFFLFGFFSLYFFFCVFLRLNIWRSERRCDSRVDTSFPFLWDLSFPFGRCLSVCPTAPYLTLRPSELSSIRASECLQDCLNFLSCVHPNAGKTVHTFFGPCIQLLERSSEVSFVRASHCIKDRPNLSLHLTAWKTVECFFIYASDCLKDLPKVFYPCIWLLDRPTKLFLSAHLTAWKTVQTFFICASDGLKHRPNFLRSLHPTAQKIIRSFFRPCIQLFQNSKTFRTFFRPMMAYKAAMTLGANFMKSEWIKKKTRSRRRTPLLWDLRHLL